MRATVHAQSPINSDYSTSIYLPFSTNALMERGCCSSSTSTSSSPSNKFLFVLPSPTSLASPLSPSPASSFSFHQRDEIRQTKKDPLFPGLPTSSSNNNNGNNSRTSDWQPIKSHLLSPTTGSTSAPRSLTCVLLAASGCEFK